MANLREYKCPCCGGAISFDSTLQKMKCPYCDTEFEVETLKEFDEELKKGEKKQDNLKWENVSSTWDEDGLIHYICTSCGGEVIGDETLGATSCPFCGNPVVIMEQFKGTLKPDWVIPFKLDKEAAKQQLANHFKKMPFLPKLYTQEQHLEEIKGVYVPVWLYDAHSEGYSTFKATRVRHWSDARYSYTETKHYRVSRSGNLDFQRIPVDGCTKMDDALMESIQPYDMSELVDFQTAYLAGYLADKYDQTSDDCIERANTLAKESISEALEKTVTGYTTTHLEDTKIQLNNGKVSYALLPVWILTIKWKNNTYIFAMNGQSGKFAGDLPIDKGKTWKRILIFTIIGAINSLILGLVGMGKI